MFALRFFVKRFFSGRYFPPASAGAGTALELRHATVRSLNPARTVLSRQAKRAVRSSSTLRTVEGVP